MNLMTTCRQADAGTVEIKTIKGVKFVKKGAGCHTFPVPVTRQNTAVSLSPFLSSIGVLIGKYIENQLNMPCENRSGWLCFVLVFIYFEFFFFSH